LGVLLNKCKRRLRKYFEVRISTLHRLSLWRETKTSERDFLCKSEAVASKFSRGDTLVLGSQRSGVLTPGGEERGRAPKVLKNRG